MIRFACAAAVVALSLAGCVTPSSSPGDLSFEDLTGGGRAKGADLHARIAKASSQPLGSQANPVRVNMPAGQHAYLRRLRCADGSAPGFERVGSFGPGVFGSIIDGYKVACAGGDPKPGVLSMDMYHPDHDETAAPPGYTLAPN